MLRQSKIGSLHYFIKKRIAQLLFQNPLYRSKRFSVVMLEKVSHVFKKKSRGFLFFQNPHNVKEQGSPCFGKSFLEPRLRKRLTGESGAENIKIGNIGFFHLGDISDKIPFFKKIFRDFGQIAFVSLSCRFIPLGSKYAFRSKIVKREMKPSYSCEQVDKSDFIL